MVVVQKKEKKCCKEKGCAKRPVNKMRTKLSPDLWQAVKRGEAKCLCEKEDKPQEEKKNSDRKGMGPRVFSNFFGAPSAPYRLKELPESG